MQQLQRFYFDGDGTVDNCTSFLASRLVLSLSFPPELPLVIFVIRVLMHLYFPIVARPQATI